ncbi:hypothetical protein [Bacillus marinisedimentorum]|uniref:hypothetical protein n=1 Tax=Bacillus marinisedimentorum TaxID=1821260 RepID=UPI0008722A76|nr:hypothetical protein [Bacillus marinisedimentorum]
MPEENSREEIQRQLKNLPKPELSEAQQKHMLNQIHVSAENADNNKRRATVVKKINTAFVTLAVLIVFFLLTYSQIDNRNSEINRHAEKGTVSEYQDYPGLSAHQVALDDFYIEIPFQKGQVDITKRETGDFVYIDVKDKKNGRILYTYGESLEDGNKEEMIFREIQTEKTKIRLQTTLEMDVSSGTITRVKETNAVFSKKPTRIENDVIDAASRSGGFPAKQVEVLALLNFSWGGEMQKIYEGYVFSVIDWEKESVFTHHEMKLHGTETKFGIKKVNGKDGEPAFPAGSTGREYNVYFLDRSKNFNGKKYEMTATHTKTGKTVKLYEWDINNNRSVAKFSLDNTGIWKIDVTVDRAPYTSFIVKAE